jgi:hypothetical protein
MTNKILVYVNRDLTTFGVANSLQKKINCELYSIIEMMNEPVKFFKSQKIVDFKKKWYLFENIKNKITQPDLKYLESIEAKYKINLWQIVLTERSFLNYNKYHKFTRDEILSILEQECRFFEKVLDESQPEYIIILMTDYQHLRILHEMCKAKNIHVLLTKRSRFGFKWMITDQNRLQDLTKYLKKPENKKRDIKELQNYIQKFDPYKQGIELVEKQAVSVTKFFTSKGIKSLLNFLESDEDRERFYGLGRTKTKIFSKMISMIVKTKFREDFINKKFLKKIPKDEKFIYFPLHDEPEGVVFLSAPYFTNQLEVISNISKSIPVDYKLYVKEHQIMKKRRWRPISYYKQIMSLPNVRLVHPSVKNLDLIKNCSVLTTIAGTSGVEAAFYLKPSINLVDSGYSILPSVYHLKNLEELPKIIKQALSTKVEISDLNNYVNIIEANSFHANLLDAFGENHPFHGSIQPNNEITNEIMNKWLEEKVEIFDLWADEIIKKIKIIENYSGKK